jgi:hypothetical protein
MNRSSDVDVIVRNPLLGGNGGNLEAQTSHKHTQTFLFPTHASASALHNCAADNSFYISSSTAVMSLGSSATMICFQSLSSAFFCLE